MNKFRNLKLFGLICILAFALVFIGFHLLQAQEKSKGKPPDKGKPKEEMSWSVIIPDIDGNMLFGTEDVVSGNIVDHEYVSNEKDWVSLVKLGYRGERGKGFYYQINFWIHPPTQAGFQGVDFSSLNFTDGGIPCAFPYGCDYDDPGCLQCFLNNPHPESEYTSFRIFFGIFDFDIENMESYGLGTPIVDLSDYEGHYGFSIWHSGECPPDYHNVASTVGVPPKSPISGLSIQRIAYDKWRIFVDQDMDVKEIYCEEKTGKGRKLTRIYRVPIAGTARFNFQMDWIKNIVE